MVVESDLGSKYIQEWMIPWKQMADSMKLNGNTWDGKSLKFDIQTADNTGLPAGSSTGGRTQQCFWNSNLDIQWDDTRAMGLIKLTTPVTNLFPLPINDQLKNARDSVKMLQTQLLSCQSGVVSISILQMDSTTSIYDLSGINVKLKIYPNPATSEVKLECSSLIEKYEIYSLVGALVELKPVNSNIASLQVNGLQAGIYGIKITTSDGVIRRKLVIRK